MTGVGWLVAWLALDVGFLLGAWWAGWRRERREARERQQWLERRAAEDLRNRE